MQKQSSRAAGILIALGALTGFGWGLLKGDPNWWALVGTAAGAALALLLWFIDRRRIR